VNARPIDAADVNSAPSYEECHQRILRVARKRYGGRVVDGEIKGFASAGPLRVNDLVRPKIFTSGHPTTNVSFEKSNKKSHLNYGEIHRIVQVSPARGFKATTYRIEDMSGDTRNGWWDRAQLLKIDPRTSLDVVSDDDEEDDDDEADEDRLDPQPPPPVYARPAVGRGVHRYSVGDVLSFVQPGWDHAPAIPGGQRTREGTVARAYQTQIGGVNALVYSIRFTLVNGRVVSRTYEAKPLPDDDDDFDPNEAVDTSQNVRYVHS
jgi:hypothetical protein